MTPSLWQCGRGLKALIACVVIAASGASHAQTPAAPPREALPAVQLEALVAPLAGVPQAILPAALDACRHPADVMEAAAALAHPDPVLKTTWNPGVQFLARYAPDVLGVLARDVRATAALGDAYARQPNDVWRAFGAVEMRARQAAQPAAAPARPVAPATPAQPAATAPAATATATAVAATPAAPVRTLPPCEAYGNPLRGAARGAATGALVGAISENAGRGAAIGATAGGVAGAARRGAARRQGACY